ncbi:hypothetical protein [Priestia endophytica]|uniref:hypothetical protein n=1 Tax=Priestia endophytica TaxID=135735 RepID=UPI00227FE135|nr:hypothetical protein [Priestia endophytica]MCY8232253.1 hypothetical protein [Priestia endophytica]
MNTHLTRDSALSIAENYKNKYNLSGNILEEIEHTITFHDEFDSVNGPIWLVTVSIKPHELCVEKEYTIVVSDKEELLNILLIRMGVVFTHI